MHTFDEIIMSALSKLGNQSYVSISVIRAHSASCSRCRHGGHSTALKVGVGRHVQLKRSELAHEAKRQKGVPVSVFFSPCLARLQKMRRYRDRSFCIIIGVSHCAVGSAVVLFCH